MSSNPAAEPQSLRERRDLVVIGASAGGVEALRTLVSELPPDLPARVLVVLHLPRGGTPSLLPEILQRASRLPVRAAVDGEVLRPGTVLVAPSDRHLMLHGDRVVLSSGARENGQRPAVDATLRSAAAEHGGRVVGVVLTGNLDDGSAGLRAVVRHGGLAVVQDPDDAVFPGMPRNALLAVPEARTVVLDDLAACLLELVHTVADPADADPDPPAEAQQERAEIGTLLGQDVDLTLGEASPFACPDCHGVLFSVHDGPFDRFRCRVGHAWSAESLVERQGQAVETALWMALRALEERSDLARRVARTAAAGGRAWSVRHFEERAGEADRHAEVLRRLLLTHAEGITSPPVEEPAVDLPD